MTAPDSVERVVAEMRCALGKGCTPQSAIREWADRLQALARGPQQAGGEVAELFDWLRWLAGDKREVKALEQHYAALQAEVARLNEQAEHLRRMYRNACRELALANEATLQARAALREAGRDADRWRFLTSMDVGEYIGLVEYNNPDELAHAIDAARLVRDGDSGEGE